MMVHLTDGAQRPGVAGGFERLRATLARFGAPVSGAEPGPLQRVLGAQMKI